MTHQQRHYPVHRERDDEVRRPTSVYRIFDSEGRLLYIGCAEDVNHRIYMHRYTYSMVDCAVIQQGYARHTSVQYRTKAKARAAERAAIEAEAPYLNRQHNPKRWRKVKGAGYVCVEPAADQALRDAYAAEREALRNTPEALALRAVLDEIREKAVRSLVEMGRRSA